MTNKTGDKHSKSKTVFQYDKDWLIVNTFGSAREAARVTGMNYGIISCVLIGKGKTAGGFYFKY